MWCFSFWVRQHASHLKLTYASQIWSASLFEACLRSEIFSLLFITIIHTSTVYSTEHLSSQTPYLLVYLQKHHYSNFPQLFFKLTLMYPNRVLPESCFCIPWMMSPPSVGHLYMHCFAENADIGFLCHLKVIRMSQNRFLFLDKTVWWNIFSILVVITERRETSEQQKRLNS